MTFYSGGTEVDVISRCSDWGYFVRFAKYLFQNGLACFPYSREYGRTLQSEVHQLKAFIVCLLRLGFQSLPNLPILRGIALIFWHSATGVRSYIPLRTQPTEAHTTWISNWRAWQSTKHISSISDRSLWAAVVCGLLRRWPSVSAAAREDRESTSSWRSLFQVKSAEDLSSAPTISLHFVAYAEEILQHK